MPCSFLLYFTYFEANSLICFSLINSQKLKKRKLKKSGNGGKNLTKIDQMVLNGCF